MYSDKSCMDDSQTLHEANKYYLCILFRCFVVIQKQASLVKRATLAFFSRCISKQVSLLMSL